MKASLSQTIFDVSLSMTGGIESFLEICVKNDRNPSDSIEAGAFFSEIISTKKEVSAYFQSAIVKPSNVVLSTFEGEGIELMAVEIDFIVS